MKEKYKPSERRRFEISKDNLSRERLKAIHDLSIALKEEFPEVHTGVVLFGSLSKGKVLRKPRIATLDIGNSWRSDIDLMCFFDYEDVRIHLAELRARFPHVPLSSRTIAENDPDFESMLCGYMSSLLRPAIEKFLTARLGNKVPVDFYLNPLALTGPYSIRTNVDRLIEDQEKETRGEKLPEASNDGTVANTFGLDIGGGMKRFRQAFLGELLEMDNVEAERYWSVVNTYVRGWEREHAHPIPENIEKQFPATFADAIAYYGVGPRQDHELRKE